MPIGYALSSEEHGPRDLVSYAQRAEQAGFDFLGVSDHFHPWVDRQGQSPFVWSVLGGIAATTDRIRVGTGVTCPTVRIHPAIIAQAAATTAAMMPGRFFLGVGSGEALNEHILGDRWPEVDVRLEMLEEAVEVIRLLWEGGLRSHHGKHYTVENARLYTLPPNTPEIVVAASGPKAAELAGRIGDGLWGVAPDADLVKTFEAGSSRTDAPRLGQVTVCWAPTEEEARKTALEWWPNAANQGQLSQELALPSFFEDVAKLATEDKVAEAVVCGPDPERHVAAIKEFFDAGFDHVYVHQVGPDQAGFFDFFEREVMARVR